MKKRRSISRLGGERGFTLIELMISMALLGVGTAFIIRMFMTSYQLWKRSFDEMLLQRDARLAMARMVQVMREAKPGTMVISKSATGGNFSKVSFQDGRGRGWIFRQDGAKLYYVTALSSGVSVTQFLGDNLETLVFSYPSFQDVALVDIALTMKKTPYYRANPIIIQLVERVMVRNP